MAPFGGKKREAPTHNKAIGDALIFKVFTRWASDVAKVAKEPLPVIRAPGAAAHRKLMHDHLLMAALHANKSGIALGEVAAGLLEDK